jgi:hypothetical protein
MSEVVKGFVAKINARPVNTRKGPRTSYSMKLAREDGTEIDGWISVGWEAPNFNEGDYVKVTYAKNERGYLDASEVKPLKNAPERVGGNSASRPTSRGPSSGASASGGRAYDPKGPTIHYQNSRTAAIELVGLMLAHDALPISGAQTKAGAAKRYDELVALVNKLTVQFYFDVETLRLTKSVADAGAEKPKAKDADIDEDDNNDEETTASAPVDEDDDE